MRFNKCTCTSFHVSETPKYYSQSQQPDTSAITKTDMCSDPDVCKDTSPSPTTDDIISPEEL